MGFYERQTNHTFAAKPVTMFGCDFRSRLEAKWAIVFTELGVRWEYEPRMFRTTEGGYIPDFHVFTRRPFWVESKGPEPIERDYARAEEVSRRTNEKFRFFVGDLPDGGTGGYLRTRIRSQGRWRPADWRTPWSGPQLDTALGKALRFRFDDLL